MLSVECGYGIITSQKVYGRSIHNKWCKKYNAYKVIGHIIHGIDQSLDVVDQSVNECDCNYKKLETMFDMYINCYELMIDSKYDHSLGY